MALARGARVHVMTRSAERPAASPSSSAPPARGTPTPHRPSHSTRPSCSRRWARWCRPALAALDRGGTLAVAGIYLSDIPSLDYQAHLFEERTLRSVTANTRRDGEEFLAEAARIGLRVSAVALPAWTAADAALRDLRDDRVNGAAVLVT